MTLMRFEPGTEVTIEGEVYRFVDFIVPDRRPTWTLRRLRDGLIDFMPEITLRHLYDIGKLRRYYPQLLSEAPGVPKKRPKAQLITADLPKGDALRRHQRMEILKYVREQLGPNNGCAVAGIDDQGQSITLLQIALKRACAFVYADNERKISLATYYRWKEKSPDLEDPRGLEGDFSGRGRRNQIHPVTESIMLDVMKRLLAEAMDKKGVGKSGKVTTRLIKLNIRHRLDEQKIINPALTSSLKIPSDATLNRRWLEFPAFERRVAVVGIGRAKHEFRHVRGHAHPELPYEKIEYDETGMPFIFIDDATGIPLGKATLCVAMDVATHVQGGFYLGFEPFSDLTMICTLRHATSLKSYVASEYGERIKNPWLAGGMFRAIGLDNSKQAWGKTLKAVCSALDCDPFWLPRRTPWFKPVVEGFFHSLNQRLLVDLPGADLGRTIDRTDYDPKANACISLRTFLLIYHQWLLDVYHVEPQEGLGGRSPNQAWLDCLKNGAPGLLDSTDDLESLFGVVRDGVLDHRGVRFQNLYYVSDELQDMRMRSGARQKVRFKINPSNLYQVMVWHPRYNGWIRAVSLNREYTFGLSLYVHELVQKQTRLKDREQNIASYLIGKVELQNKIADAWPSIKDETFKEVARFANIGTQHLVAGMDHLGNLGSLAPNSSVFQQVSATADHTSHSLVNTPPLENRNVEITNSPNPPQRPKIVLEADDSLSRRGPKK